MPAFQVCDQQFPGEVLDRAAYPGRKGLFQIGAAPSPAATAPVGPGRELPERDQHRQPAAQVLGRGLGERLRGRNRVAKVLPRDASQDRPAAEGGFAGAGLRQDAKRLPIEALQQRDKAALLALR